MDFQSAKSFGKLRLRAFQPYHQYYICRHCQYKTKISNAFNAIYVDTVDTKHIHTFLPITFLIFNGFSIRKKFWKAESQGFSTIHQYYICRHCRYKTKISNVFNAIYVDTVDTFFTPHSTLYKVLCKSHIVDSVNKHSIKCIVCFDLHIDSVDKQDTLLNTQ